MRTTTLVHPTRAWRMSLPAFFEDLNAATVSTAFTAVLFYTFGAIPLYVAAVQVLDLPAGLAASGFAIAFLTSALTTAPLALAYRQPLAMGWSGPAMVYIVAVGSRYSFEEVIGANLVAGALLLVIGGVGAGERVARLVPYPIVLGAFAGSALGYCTGVFTSLGGEPLTIGATVAGYLGARAARRPWLPPVGGALLTGGAALLAVGKVDVGAVVWAPPVFALVAPRFDPGAVLAVSLPVVAIVAGMNNPQGFGLLRSQGYAAPVNLLTTVTGAASMINALFGGFPASIQRIGLAILAGEEAGPRAGRYAAAVLASAGMAVLAGSAAAASSLTSVFPASFVSALAGLVLLTAVMEALRQALAGKTANGAFIAFVIAGSGLSVAGVGPTFWALIGGVAASLALEGRDLVAAPTSGERGA